MDSEKIDSGNSNLIDKENNTNYKVIFNKNSGNNIYKTQSESTGIIIPNKEGNIKNCTNQNININSTINTNINNENNFNTQQKKSSILINNNNLSNNNSNSTNYLNYIPNNLPESNFCNNNNNMSNCPPSLLRKIKQIETQLNQKLVNITELRSIAWKGLPYGKIFLI